jgi:hypothetical protein
VLLFLTLNPSSGYAQRETAVRPANDNPTQQYGTRFFLQLRTIFGRFRDSDLHRAFDKARSIQCPDLVSEKSEWRTVAFFNEKRELGHWYRSNLEEVKSDLTVFLFSGVCRGDRGSLRLTTKFPVTESVNAYNRGEIPLENVEVNVNAPVSASYDPSTKAYTWELPYLFLIKRENNESVYSLDPPRLVGRDRYATDVFDRWECKSLNDDAVTYQFLICRSTTGRRDSRLRAAPSFGSSSYMILSDGKEASTSVKLTFSEAADATRPVPDAAVPDVADGTAPLQWQSPDSDEHVMDLARNEIRILFPIQLWSEKIASRAFLAGQKLTAFESLPPSASADSCSWTPGEVSAATTLMSKEPEKSIGYSLTAHDQDRSSSTSITLDMKTRTSTQAGTLRCVFPRLSSAEIVTYARWSSIVGDYLKLETR